MSESSYELALIGNPNSGKTTLFNVLTGSTQRIGNWAGVTVDKKVGRVQLKQVAVELVDLPGTYALADLDEQAIDERIVCDFVLNQQARCYINVIDASNLERNLYLTLQLLEQGAPIVVALNMIDVVKAQGNQIDIAALAEQLGVPVVAISATKRQGLQELQATVDKLLSNKYPVKTLTQHLPKIIRAAQQNLINTCLPQQQAARALLYLEGINQTHDDSSLHHDQQLFNQIKQAQHNIQDHFQEDPDIIIADARYRWIKNLVTLVVQEKKSKQSFTAKLDKIILHKYLGIPIFLLMMYTMFFFAIDVGGALQDFFDKGSTTLFVEGGRFLLSFWHMPNWLIVLVADGIGRGINTVVTFIPVIGFLFLFLSFLEGSGYMARAAFVVDRLMQAIGLPGKAFVPLIVGFGCNVPSIMGARTLENKRDRIVTIMMSPFMSCGARFSVYALFVAAFFPKFGSLIVFALYLIGIVFAMITAWVIQLFFYNKEASSFILELPPYHWPTCRAMGLQAWHRLKAFLFKAGKIIMPVVILLSVLGSISTTGQLTTTNDKHSVLAKVGQEMVPVFEPMGIRENNWPATVGLFTGVMAKEVVVGTLNSLYSQISEPEHAATGNNLVPYNLKAGMMDALESIPDNFINLKNALINPISAQHGLDDDVTHRTLGEMAKRFDGQAGAFAYLLFVLLYIPCISATAAIGRESGKGWMWVSVVWSFMVAYFSAVLFYQAATMMRHPLQMISWYIIVSLIFGGVFIFLKQYAKQFEEKLYAT